VLLILLALAMFALEMKFVSHGILSAGGAVALVLGATMLVDSPVPEMQIHLSTALGVAAPLAIITAFLVMLVVRARRNKVVTGAEGMVGQLGTALEDLSPEGRILVHGENWLARSPVNVKQGAKVRVLSIRDLRLRVEPVAESEERESV
jgi:membrane-bound serine protease (ClpP class)